MKRGPLRSISTRPRPENGKADRAEPRAACGLHALARHADPLRSLLCTAVYMGSGAFALHLKARFHSNWRGFYAAVRASAGAGTGARHGRAAATSADTTMTPIPAMTNAARPPAAAATAAPSR